MTSAISSSSPQQERDQQIAEITKWITTTDTDEGKIKVLEEQILETEKTLLAIKDRIEDYEGCISSEKNNYDYFYKEGLEKRKGVKLLSDRIKEKRGEKINN